MGAYATRDGGQDTSKVHFEQIVLEMCEIRTIDTMEHDPKTRYTAEDMVTPCRSARGASLRHSDYFVLLCPA